MVSVVIPTHNRRDLIGETIRSVLNQTFEDFEVLVVDNGSTDDTEQVVRNFRDPRIRYIYQENTGGPAGPRNTGIRQSRGKYIAFLDSDDVWMPNKLEREIALLESNRGIDVVYCAGEKIDAKGVLLNSDWVRPRSWGTLCEDLLYGNVVSGGSAALLRADCFARVGLFDETLRLCEDLDMWRRLALAGYQFLFVDEALVRIRVHTSSMLAGATQANLDERIAGDVRYLTKVIREVPERLRRHIPGIKYRIYLSLVFESLKRRRVLKGGYFIIKIASLGPTYFWGLALDMVDILARKLGLRRLRLRRPPRGELRTAPWLWLD